MKRHESIIPLSRDHHHALLFCWKLKQGIQKSVQPDRLSAYTKYFFEQYLHPHFRLEEQVLFSKSQDQLCTQAIDEHQQLEQIVSIIKQHHRIQDIATLVLQLEAHIRFEERVLFPHLEQILSSATLLQIAAEMPEDTGKSKDDDFDDRFWQSNKY